MLPLIWLTSSNRKISSVTSFVVASAFHPVLPASCTAYLHITNFSILCLDLDRNIFDDAWNGIQDAGHAIQDAGNAAWNAAATTKDVTELIFRCKDVAIDLVQSVNVGQIKGELQPMLKDGLKNDDFKTIGHLVEGYSDKMHRFGECMSQEGEFKPQDSWWNPFGRAGQFRRMETVSDRGFQLPHAYSLSITGTAGM